MATSKLTELPELTDPADPDWIYAVDASDTSGGPQGSSKKLSFAKLDDKFGQPGNILNSEWSGGADPTGVEDSSAAIQAVINSEYPLYAPAGLYRVESPIVINTGKIWWNFGGLKIRSSIVGGDGSMIPATVRKYEQARFFTTSDINIAEIRSQEVHIRGGLFELKHSAPTKACIYMPLVANGTSSGGTVGDTAGWGGTIKDVVLCGSELHLHVTDGGGTGINFDFDQAVANAYWTHLEIDVEMRCLKYGIYAGARNPGFGQFANNCEWKVRAQAVKSAIYNNAGFNNLVINLWHQGDSIFLTEAESDAYYSLYLRGGEMVIEQARYFDFGKGQHNNGWWHNKRKQSVVSADHTQRERDAFVSISQDACEGQTHWEAIVNPIGFIPHTSISDRKGLFIAELHDEFMAHALAGTVTWGVYSGVDVIAGGDPATKFGALLGTSASNAIPTSTDVTLANTANFLLYTQARPSATWNAQGVTDNDYVEILITGAGAKSFDWMRLVVGNQDDVYPKYIQLIRHHTNPLAPSENIFKTVNSMVETRNALRTHVFELVNGTANLNTIVRLIGCNLASTPVNINGLYGHREVFFDGAFPVLYRNNIGTLYAPMLFGANGGIVMRMATTAQLSSISNEINTGTAKRLGFTVYNTTTKTNYVAQDDQDGSVWISTKDGTTTITPV